MEAGDTPSRAAKWRSRCRRAPKRTACACLLLLLLYAALVVVGMIPVNNDFEPTEGGVEILVSSSSVHADVVLPVCNDVIDWRREFPAEYFSGDVSAATHVAIGWGDKGFYIHTPTWSDLRASTTAKALFWPSGSCVHVSFTTRNQPDARAVTISEEQYRDLVAFLRRTMRYDEDGDKIPIPGAAYTWYDAFFEAEGYYHCLNTCNCWVGRGMRAAGIRTGWFTPMPKTVFLYLPKDEGTEKS